MMNPTTRHANAPPSSGISNTHGESDADRDASASAHRFRVILEKSLGAAALLGGDGSIQHLSPAALQLLDYDANALVGQDAFRLLHEEEAPAARKRFDHLLQVAGASDTSTHRVWHHQGRWRWIEARATNLMEEPEVQAVVVVLRDVTEEKEAAERVQRAQRQSAESLALLETLLTKAPVGFALVDREFRYMRVNEALARTNGLSPEAHVGKPVRDVVPDLWPQIEPVYRRLLAGEDFVANVHFRGETPAVPGDIRDWLVSFYPIEIDGDRIGIGVVVNEVTEIRRAQMQQEKLAKHVDLLLESTGEGIYGLDTQGTCTFINRAGAEMLGYRREEIIGNNVHNLIHHHRKDGTPLPNEECPILQAYREGKGIHIDGEFFHRKDGTRFPVDIYSHPLMVGDKIQGAVVTFNDITERIQAEQALRKERKFLHAVLDTIEDGVMACDEHGRLTLSNRAARVMHGGAEEPIPPTGWFQRFPRFDPLQHRQLERHELPLIRALNGESVRNLEVEIMQGSGTRRPVLVTGQPVLGEDGRKIGGMVALHDRLERRQLEEQIRQAQKMEAIGQLAGGVAHDFNNLLTVINGYSEMLLGGMDPGDGRRELIGEIHKAGKRSATLTRQLLAFSRKQVLAPRLLDINSVIVEMEKMLRRMIGEDVVLVTRLGGEAVYVNADPGQLEQVLMNLAVNARDAMPQGGTLTLETQTVELTAARSEGHPGTYVMVRVADTGCGMSAEVQSRIFEPFFTTKGLGKGTGLGLATVYGIVKQSGGQIEVFSQEGEGSTFVIYLPALPRPGRAAATGDLPARSTDGQETVLIVEDDTAVRALMSHVLRDAGYRVLEAGRGEDAIALCRTHPDPIDLLLSDVVMPGLGGRLLAERLLTLQPEMRVLFLSGYTDDAIVRHGVLHDQVNFLQKPFSPLTLLQTIRAVIDSPRTAKLP